MPWDGESGAERGADDTADHLAGNGERDLHVPIQARATLVAMGIVRRAGRMPAAKRRIVLGAVLVTAGVLALVGVRLEQRAEPEQVDDIAAETLQPCLPTGDLDTIDAVNEFVTGVRGTDGFAGGDVGASVELQDGRRIFVFGDTLRGLGFAGQQFVRNSMLVFSPDCAQVVMPQDRGAVVPDRADGVGYWPMSIARVERDGYDLVGMGLQRVRATGGSGVFDFEILGPAIAQFVVPRGGVPELQEVRDFGPDRVDTTQPMWGAAAYVDGDRVYVYGTSRAPDAVIGGFDLRVARVRPETIADASTWRYWDGTRWSRDASSATVLIPADGGVSQTLSVFRVDDLWYALSKRDEVLGTDLTIWTAPAPTGPFVAASPSASIPSDAATGTLRYLPLAHPDLLPEPGTVVVSYSENNTDFHVVQDDPRRYRPRFLRVELP